MNPVIPFHHELDFQGVRLRSRVTHLSASDVDVELLSPFSGLSCSLHTPYFAMQRENRNLDPGGTITAKGWLAIRSCMESAYERVRALSEHREELLDRIARLEAECREIEAQSAAFEDRAREEKQRLRKALKAGGLTQSEYQASLKSLRAAIRLNRLSMEDVSRRLRKAAAIWDGVWIR